MIHPTKQAIQTGIKIGVALILTFCALAHTALFNYQAQKVELAAFSAIKNRVDHLINKKHGHKVAFHLAADVPALRQLIDSAERFCAAHGVTLDGRRLYHNQDFTLLKAQIEESIERGSEVIVTIGNASAQHTHNILVKRDYQEDIPHVFTCVSDPVGLGISKNAEYTGYNSTGISAVENTSNDVFVKSLLHVRPSAKKVLIFYSNTSPHMPHVVATLINLFAQKGVHAAGVITATLDDVQKFAESYITRDIDAVVALRDVVVISGLQAILKACRAHGTTAFVSDSNSVYDGAAAGCCVEEAEIGLMLGELLLKIIEKKEAAAHIPITYFNTALLCRTYINPHEMNAQGLHNRGIYNLMAGDIKLSFLPI